MSQMSDGIQQLSREQIKKWALFCMVLDHVGAAILDPALITGQFGTWGGMVSFLSLLFHLIGRMAFPIFAFFLTEGFFHTRDLARYQKRLLLFACLSEIPYDLAVSGQWINLERQNTIMTLTLGLWMMQKISKRRSRPMVCLGYLMAAMTVSYLFRLDYSVYGIALIAVFYWFYADKKSALLLGAVFSFFDSMGYLGAAALAYIPLSLYSREKGKKQGHSWEFYLFYPLHLLVLGVLRQFFT